MKTLSLLLLLSTAAAAQGPVVIGVAGAVGGRVSATAPGAAQRGIASGADVFHKDDVVTDARGRLQVMLKDQTVFTVGPNSRMLLDEFVYDPFTSAGKVTAQVTKGVFRFVTGKVAEKKPDEMKIKLPTGTVGIRGTIAGGKVEDDGSALIALLGPGPDNNADERQGGLTVSNAGQSVDIDQPGYATRIPGPDQGPTPPFPLTPELLASLSVAPEAPAGEGAAPGAAPASASEESGQTTAAGGESAGVTGELGETQDGLDKTSAFAAQTLAFSGGVTWESLRAALQSGTAFYDAVGSYLCTGGTCSTGNSGTWTVHFDINWGTRVLGGNGANSHFAFDGGGSGLLNTGGGAPVIYEAQIPATSFANLTGATKMTMGTDFTAANGNNAFNGSAFEFTDGGRGITASLSYNGNNQNGGSAAYVAGTTASGTATGSCTSGTCPP